MIPFASQRANGQDLAVHLMNEQDNDLVELIDLRGTVSNDVSGAFAEWDFQRKAYTNCDKFLYSLSINGDPKQAPLTHGQYMEYLDDVERTFGLENQGRAIVRHIKNGREHYHAVYSRIDAENKRAIPISFDKVKLMRLTRDFAQRHDIELPKGYSNTEDRAQSSQLSLYDKVQEQATGISKQERSDFVTDCWRRRDSPTSFVAELEEGGYILASGRRPYVLVDRFGHINSLARLINDPAVRIKHVKAFLAEEYPKGSLPDAEDIKKRLNEGDVPTRTEAEEHRRERKEKSEALKASQVQRRTRLQVEEKQLRANQQRQRESVIATHREKMQKLRAQYTDEKERAHQTKLSSGSGLKALLARASGYQAVMKAIRRYKDRRRLKQFLEEKARLHQALKDQQTRDNQIHDVQLLELRRKERALNGIEKREEKSLETSLSQKRIYRMRKGLEHMPALELALTPPGRKVNVHRARHRHTHSEKVYKPRDEAASLADYFNEQANPRSDKTDSDSLSFEKLDRDKGRRR